MSKWRTKNYKLMDENLDWWKGQRDNKTYKTEEKCM